MGCRSGGNSRIILASSNLAMLAEDALQLFIYLRHRVGIEIAPRRVVAGLSSLLPSPGHAPPAPCEPQQTDNDEFIAVRWRFSVECSALPAFHRISSEGCAACTQEPRTTAVPEEAVSFSLAGAIFRSIFCRHD